MGALVDTTLRQSIRIMGDGSAAVDAEVLFENSAGTDPPSVLLGRPVGGIPVGTFAADVTLLVPATARDIAAETSRPSPIEIGSDLGPTSVTGSILVRGRRVGDAHGHVRRPGCRQDGRRTGTADAPGAPAADAVRRAVPARDRPPGGANVVSTSPELERGPTGRRSPVSAEAPSTSSCDSVPARLSRASGRREVLDRLGHPRRCVLILDDRIALHGTEQIRDGVGDPRALLAGRDADAAVVEDLEEVLEDRPLVAEERGLGDVERLATAGRGSGWRARRDRSRSGRAAPWGCRRCPPAPIGSAPLPLGLHGVADRNASHRFPACPVSPSA